MGTFWEHHCFSVGFVSLFFAQSISVSLFEEQLVRGDRNRKTPKTCHPVATTSTIWQQIT